MTWNGGREPEKFDKAKMEREVAIRRANRWCGELRQELENTLQAVRQDPDDSIKRAKLKEKANFCRLWGGFLS